MNRAKYITDAFHRDPYPEVGQIWQRRNCVTDAILLNGNYGKGFHCLFVNRQGNCSFNYLDETFFRDYKFDCWAKPAVINNINVRHNLWSER